MLNPQCDVSVVSVSVQNLTGGIGDLLKFSLGTQNPYKLVSHGRAIFGRTLCCRIRQAWRSTKVKCARSRD